LISFLKSFYTKIGTPPAPSPPDFSRGFHLARPEVCLPWGVAEAEAIRLLSSARVRGLGGGRFHTRCQLLGGVETELELRFRPRKNGRLCQVEFMRSPTERRRQAFENWQALLVGWLGSGVDGPAHAIGHGLAQIVPSRWQLGSVAVTHDYYFQGAQYEKVLFSWAGSGAEKTGAAQQGDEADNPQDDPR
jgi:hypothetical protein